MAEQQDPPAAPGSSPGRTPPSASQVVARLLARPRVTERYELQGEIARGGMGRIEKVLDLDLRRALAMKVLLEPDSRSGEGPSEAAESRRKARFLEEAQITGQLDHPGIVPVHDLGIDAEGRLCFTMKLVKGRDLREILELVRDGREGWNLTRALGVLLRVCEAMAFAHEKGVIHRDLKPANVMVGRFGEVYVMDWGLAKVLGRPDPHDVRLASEATRSLVRTERKDRAGSAPDSSLATMDGDVVGTPCYMAPEQAKGRLDDIGPHSDVYALGSMLYQLLSGAMPYAGKDERVSPHVVLGLLIQGEPEPLAKIARGQPEELIAIAEKAMARDPRERYRDMAGVADDLRAFLEGRVVRAHETGAVAEFKKWIERNRSFATAVAAAIAAVVALSGALVWQQVAAKSRLQVERDRAVDAEKAADTARVEMEKQRDAARRANALYEQSNVALTLASTEIQRRGYANAIAAADASLQVHDVAAARSRLHGCVADLRGWEWSYLTGLCSGAVAEFARLEDEKSGAVAVTCVAAGASGRLLAVAAEDARKDMASRSRIRLFDLERGAELGSCEGLQGYVVALAMDPAGRRLVAATTDRKLQVFDLGQRKLATAWTTAKAPTGGLLFGPDGREIAYLELERELVIVDAESGAKLRSLSEPGTRLRAAAWSPDGARIALGTADGRVQVWTADGRLERTIGERGASVTCLAFSPDSQLVLAGTSRATVDNRARPMQDTVREWEVASGRLLDVWSDHDDGVTWCGYARGGRWIVSASLDATIRVRDTLQAETRILRGHDGAIRGAALLSATGELVTGGEDAVVRSWDLGLGESLSLTGHRLPPTQIAFLADGERLVSLAPMEGAVRLWSARTGTMTKCLLRVATTTFGGQAARSLAASPVGSRIAVGRNDGRIVVLDANAEDEPGNEPFELRGPDEASVSPMAFSPDGARLATATTGGPILVWDLAARSLAATLRESSGTVSALLWSGDGSALFAGTDTSALARWDVASGERTALVEKCGEQPVALDRAGDGTLLVWAGRMPSRAKNVQGDRRVALLVREDDLSTEREVEIDALRGWLMRFDEGRRWVGTTPLGTAAVIDPSSGETLLVLGRAGDLRSLAVDATGRRVAAGCLDGTVRSWSCEPASEVHEARRAEARAEELARPYVARLFEELGLRSEAAQDAIRRDESISEPLRLAALRLAGRCGGDADFLRTECWEACRSPRCEAKDLQLALWQALELEAADPRDDRAAFLHASVRYRLGQLERAAERLKRAAELRSSGRVAVDELAVQALVAARLGRLDDAHADLARMRAALAQSPMQAGNPVHQDLLREVEAVVPADTRTP